MFPKFLFTKDISNITKRLVGLKDFCGQRHRPFWVWQKYLTSLNKPNSLLYAWFYTSFTGNSPMCPHYRELFIKNFHTFVLWLLYQYNMFYFHSNWIWSDVFSYYRFFPELCLWLHLYFRRYFFCTRNHMLIFSLFSLMTPFR